MKGKLIGAYLTSSLDVFAIKHPTTDRTITLTSGQVYYPTGDGTATDLVDIIHDLVRASSGEMSDITWSISTSTGIVTVANAHVSNNAVITWGTATALRDFLRFTGTTTTIAANSSTSGSRCVDGSFYPSKPVLEDLPPELALSSQTQSDSGHVETHTYGRISSLRLELRVQGTPRESSYGEWYAARDAWRRAVQGIPLRWYPDITVTTAYAEATTPYGYQAWTMREPRRWDPSPIQSRYYGWFSLPLRLDAYV